MDYQNRAGSKKGGGGLASDAVTNIHRRKQVEELLQQGQSVPYTFAEDEKEAKDDAKKLNANPYIYRNHSGKLICKLCNTMHMSWSSVERHLSGKKHGLSVLRRGAMEDRKGKAKNGKENDLDFEFQQLVSKRRSELKSIDKSPTCRVRQVKDPNTGLLGIAVQAHYPDDSMENVSTYRHTPFVRIVSGLELGDENVADKSYVVIAFEPFENVAIEIPTRSIVMLPPRENGSGVDEFNTRCTYWDASRRMYYIQFFFEEKK